MVGRRGRRSWEEISQEGKVTVSRMMACQGGKKWGKAVICEKRCFQHRSRSQTSLGGRHRTHLRDEGRRCGWLRSPWYNLREAECWACKYPLAMNVLQRLPNGMINSTSHSICEESFWKKLGQFACANCQNDEWNRCVQMGKGGLRASIYWLIHFSFPNVTAV